MVPGNNQLYVVHMKRVTASEARKNWFRLLDEVAAGGVVSIDRGGVRVVLRRESRDEAASVPDYSELISGGDLSDAHKWSWEWEAAGDLREVRPTPGAWRYLAE